MIVLLTILCVWFYLAGALVTRAMLENDLPLINRTADMIFWPLLVILTVVVSVWHFADKRIKELRAGLS